MYGLYWKFINSQLREHVSSNGFFLIGIFMPLLQLPLMYTIGGFYGELVGAVLLIVQIVCGIIGFLKD
ncbi:hypothetical protein XbC2_362 [Xanthomonas phage XbC2]|nr:hypothetical protein XbC2_362 [Xanthomonas phage XbC2]